MLSLADAHGPAAQLDPGAGAERDAVAEVERVVRGRPDVEDLAAAELHVLAEADRQRPGRAAVGMDLDVGQLVEVSAVGGIEDEPAAGAAQASVQAPRPQREARALGLQAGGAGGGSQGGGTEGGHGFARIMATRARAARG